MNNKPCSTCPFTEMVQEEKQMFVEGDKCKMLCHESQCLDGDKPDRLCVGFYQRVQREQV